MLCSVHKVQGGKAQKPVEMKVKMNHFKVKKSRNFAEEWQKTATWKSKPNIFDFRKMWGKKSENPEKERSYAAQCE